MFLLEEGAMKSTGTRISRRRFLLAASTATAATAATVVAKKEIDSAPKEDSMESKKGYQLTEHVRNYYRTAKI